MSGGAAYILELFALDGYTAAIAEVDSSQVRPIGPRDLHHARRAA